MVTSICFFSASADVRSAFPSERSAVCEMISRMASPTSAASSVLSFAASCRFADSDSPQDCDDETSDSSGSEALSEDEAETAVLSAAYIGTAVSAMLILIRMLAASFRCLRFKILPPRSCCYEVDCITKCRKLGSFFGNEIKYTARVLSRYRDARRS